MLTTIIFIIGLVVIFIFYKLSKNKNFALQPQSQNLKIYDSGDATSTVEEIPIIPEPLYQLQTHRAKYLRYSTMSLSHFSSKYLHKIVILENLWINENFYSTFFRILLVLDKDEFFIQDPSSRVITSKLRDQTNKMQKVKSYLVRSTLNILVYIFEKSLKNILRFAKEDAQIITLAILIFILDKSKHFVNKNSYDAREVFLQGYDNRGYVVQILSLIEENNKQLSFVQDTLKYAMTKVYPQPYVENDETFTTMPLPQKLPQKQLIEI